MKKNLSKLLRSAGVLGLLCASHATAAPIVYSTEAAFLAATNGGILQDFNSAPVGPIAGNEFAGFIFSPDPALGSSSDAQMEVAPGGQFFSSTNYLSIGARPFICCTSNNDSLGIVVLGNYRAFSVRFVDSFLPGQGPNEYIQVFDQANNLILHWAGPFFAASDPGNGYGQDSFFGATFDVNIGRIYINEASFDGDDVGFDDFRLRHVNGQAPEPATLLLLGLGLAGFAARRRRHR